MNFLSDDTAPVAPAILNAIAQANAGRTSRRRLDPIRRAAIIRNFERERRCPGANRDSGERAGCARYGKTSLFRPERGNNGRLLASSHAESS